ncbi:hypothetical protein GGQ97_000959 [Sphingomonas kaistensis]|uniref:LPXTG cell wall anchor domain-containing protein n=1 Tax=Sphingomonas kaistensis TaxID=298708 RepID=A0A7X6BGK1_9SPHN|nr:hypothetical protein [Sphingomonas kaistensis]NJC05166.1 hypothetical protein [Sphingomonas kaistensis]
MTRHFPILLAGLVLGFPAPLAAQTSTAPANVVVPAPPPREGTVGPEQLRDFALPGTREPSAPAAEQPRPAPAPAQRTPPPPVSRTTPQATERSEPQTSRPATQDEAPTRAAEPRPAPAATAPTVGQAPVSLAPVPLPVPAAETGEALPPITITQSGTQTSSMLPGWWPWLLVAILGGVGLALVRRQRRRPALAGYAEDEFERVAAEPVQPPPLPRAPASPPRPAPAPPPPAPPVAEAPALPSGLVTTRLRGPETRQPAVVPPPPAGGVISTRLRAWIDIDLTVREILFDGEEAVLRVDLIVVNAGSAAARDIGLEAVTTNGGENQAAELGDFFERPAATRAALAELGPLSDTMISHELRMPRAAIRAYEVQGKPMFVPVIAITAAYRIGSGEGRTGAAFLVGRTVPGSEKLAPLLLPPGPGRLLGLGVRRLDEAVRR